MTAQKDSVAKRAREQTEQKEPLVFTISEAGRLLHLSRPTAYKLAREGRLPVLHLGRRRMVVPIAALERMLAEIKPTGDISHDQ